MADAPLSGPPLVLSAAARAAAEEVREALRDAIESGRPPDLDRLRRSFDRFLEESLATSTGLAVTCARGCASCCDQQVYGVGAHEIEDLGRVVVASGRADAVRRALETRIDLYDEVRRHTERRLGESEDDREERVALTFWTRRSPCVFLDDDGACSVHARRPFACRRYFVLGPAELCRANTAADPARRGFVLEPFPEFDDLLARTARTADFDPETDRLDLGLSRWLKASRAATDSLT